MICCTVYWNQMVVGLESVCFLLLKRNVWRTLCALKQIVGGSKRGFPSETPHGFKSSPGAASAPRNRSLETVKGESRVRPTSRTETDPGEATKWTPDLDASWINACCCSVLSAETCASIKSEVFSARKSRIKPCREHSIQAHLNIFL